ncbi:MAG: hypothetical protein Q8J74_03225 [Candidatus Didemnitutus sp.]|nr:hypothetical protein [Candidatus Didemnitutus sp.]
MKTAKLLPLLLLTAMLPGLAAAKYLSGTNAAKWKVGEGPPRPWQYNAPEAGTSVRIVQHEGTAWIELRDDSASLSASLRQEFSPLKSARLSLRIALPEDHRGEFGIYVGTGNASSTDERIVDLKTNSRGVLRMGSGGERVDSSLVLPAGTTTHVFVEFRAKGSNLLLRVGRIGVDGRDELLGEHTFPERADLVTRLRITTDNAATGSRVLVSNLLLQSVSG